MLVRGIGSSLATNEEFARFVLATDYVTVSERTLEQGIFHKTFGSGLPIGIRLTTTERASQAL
jgi:hypothetical protein